jgi:hypothetical protein
MFLDVMENLPATLLFVYGLTWPGLHFLLSFFLAPCSAEGATAIVLALLSQLSPEVFLQQLWTQ